MCVHVMYVHRVVTELCIVFDSCPPEFCCLSSIIETINCEKSLERHITLA